MPRSVFLAGISLIHRRVEPELSVLLRKCRDRKTFLDVGAWYGPYTYYLSKRFAFVHAFEPNPAVVADLIALKRNNVMVHPVAVSDVSGTATFYLSGLGRGTEGESSLIGDSGNSSNTSIEVSTLSIDSLSIQDVDLIKIDVEGHEEAVVRGAINTIHRYHPVLLIELEDRHADVASTISFLENLGYSGSVLINKKMTSLSDFDLIKFQRQFHANSKKLGYIRAGIFRSKYLNNVFFVHDKSPWKPF